MVSPGEIGKLLNIDYMAALVYTPGEIGKLLNVDYMEALVYIPWRNWQIVERWLHGSIGIHPLAKLANCWTLITWQQLLSPGEIGKLLNVDYMAALVFS